MNIYYKKYDVRYGGGMILVAAHDEEEAKKIVSDNGDYDGYLKNRNDAYWQKIEGATIDCDKPHIIDEDSYTE